MRGLLCIAALALVTSIALPATATEYRGSILVGHPLTQSSVQAVNERLAPCDTESPYNGLDSVWFELVDPAGAAATLTMDVTLDADAYFWTPACQFNGDFACASKFQGETETCVVPAGVKYISVAGWTGTGNFVLTIA